MIFLWIILGILIICACVGLTALAFDLLENDGNSHKARGPYERFVKRPLDAFLATGALIVLSPILIITAVLVRISRLFHAGSSGKR